MVWRLALAEAVFLNLFLGHTPPALGTVAGSLELQQDLLNAKPVYRPPNIATASNGMPPQHGLVQVARNCSLGLSDFPCILVRLLPISPCLTST
jgi:hypothetical protein